MDGRMDGQTDGHTDWFSIISHEKMKKNFIQLLATH